MAQEVNEQLFPFLERKSVQEGAKENDKRNGSKEQCLNWKQYWKKNHRTYHVQTKTWWNLMTAF